jgi:hypothetical protein
VSDVLLICHGASPVLIAAHSPCTQVGYVKVVEGDVDVKGDAGKEKKPRSSEHTQKAGTASTRKLQLVTVHGKVVPATKFATLLCDAGGLVGDTDRDRAAAKCDTFLLFPHGRANCE